MNQMIDDQRADAALRRFLAADADDLAESALGEFEMAARVQAHLGGSRFDRRLVLLAAAALLIASLAATAIGVGTGLIRPPWKSDLPTDRQGHLVVFAYDDPLPTPGAGTFDRQPGTMVLVDPQTGKVSTLASVTPAAAYAEIGTLANPTEISWSADGSQLSFRSEGNTVWLADALGVHFLAACGGGNPCWSELSPDGRYLALNSDFAPSVVNIATGEGTRVVPSSGDWMPEEMTWSPDSLRVAVGMWTPGGYSLFIVNRDGSDLHELTSRTSGPAGATGHPRMTSLNWSPDGTRIAYLLGETWLGAKAPSLVVVALDGSDPTVLLADLTAARGVAWSPDGKQLAVVYAADDRTDANFLGLPSLFVVNVDGTDLRLVHPNVDGVPTWRPNWSPPH